MQPKASLINIEYYVNCILLNQQFISDSILFSIGNIKIQQILTL